LFQCLKEVFIPWFPRGWQTRKATDIILPHHCALGMGCTSTHTEDQAIASWARSVEHSHETFCVKGLVIPHQILHRKGTTLVIRPFLLRFMGSSGPHYCCIRPADFGNQVAQVCL
jgi:hypothetical protein